MPWCRWCCTVAALADAHRVINRPKAKKERIAFAPINIRFSFDARTAPRLHSSDDGLLLAPCTLRGFEEGGWQFGDFCALQAPQVSSIAAGAFTARFLAAFR